MNLAPLVEQVTERRSLGSAASRRAIRKKAGLSLRAIAEALEVDTSTVQRWERGITTPRGEHLSRYAELLSVLQRVSS